jgi:hypothetical protein
MTTFVGSALVAVTRGFSQVRFIVIKERRLGQPSIPIFDGWEAVIPWSKMGPDE